MCQEMKSIKYLIVILILINCGPKIDIYKQIIPKIEIKQAIIIATKLLDSCCKNEFICDSIKVWEWPADITVWNVEFKRKEWPNIKPPTIIISINKENGNAKFEMQE